MLLKKRELLLLSFFFVMTGLLLSWFYRPYIYSNQINDFYFADTIGNLFGFPAWLFFFKSVSQKRIPTYQVFLIGILFFLFYEVIAFWGTFDWYDCIAVFISAAITWFGIIMLNIKMLKDD
jgi:hypothetical protein